jgi:tRNA1(Val) A37 N6-methylase TrmN6
MIVRNRLLDFASCIYQNDDWFKFSLDSVLLVNFVTLNLRCKKIMDLCTGNAPIPMLLTYKTNAFIYGIEIQKCVYDLGIKSIVENNFNDRINLINGDIKNISNYCSSDSYDTVLCNPPYFKTNEGGYFCYNDVKNIARHEVMLKIDDVFKSARYLLKTGGNFAMIHRSERFMELVLKMREYNLEPKKVQFIYSKSGKNSDLFLIEGIKNGKIGLKVLPPLVVYNDDGSYTNDVRYMFSNKGDGD